MILKNIERLCRERNISIAALERDAGIGNGVIRRWGEGNPRVDLLKKVADKLDVTVDELLRSEAAEDPGPQTGKEKELRDAGQPASRSGRGREVNAEYVRDNKRRTGRND